MKQLFGKKPLLDYINSKRIKLVELSDKQKDHISLLKSKNIPFKIVGENDLNKKYHHTHHQGIVVTLKEDGVEDKWQTLLKNKKALILILDGIQDPNNFGAILRTAESFSVDCVIYKKDNQVQVNETVSRVSMGAIGSIFLYRVANLVRTIDELKKNGFWVYGTLLNANATDVMTVKFHEKSCLVVGNENKGISKLVAEHCDSHVYIKTTGNTQSLNVSVATGILINIIKNNE